MTNPCSSLAVIFCGFISHLISRKTMNIPEIFSGVHGFTGKTVIKSLLPKYKDDTVNLQRKSIVRPSINTERYKNSFFNRLIFEYNLAV